MDYEFLDAKKIMGEAVYEMARDDSRIIMISTDSASRSGFSSFIKDFPDRYFELGIMEQSALSVASGFATTGKIPVFCAPAPFVTGRPFEMFKIDLGYMQQNVKIIGRNCGLNYADLGPTHFGLEDYALVRMIPKVVILAPQDASERKSAIKAMMEYEGPVYLRVSTGPLPKIFDEKPFQIGKGNVIREGKDLTIVTTGEITRNVLAATEILVSDGIDPMVIGMPSIRPFDETLLVEAAKRTGKVVTVEEHFNIGGLGTIVCELCSASCPVPVLRLGVRNDYISSGPYIDLLAEVGLDTDSLVVKITEFMGK
jgi:transketolase